MSSLIHSCNFQICECFVDCFHWCVQNIDVCGSPLAACVVAMETEVVFLLFLLLCNKLSLGYHLNLLLISKLVMKLQWQYSKKPILVVHRRWRYRYDLLLRYDWDILWLHYWDKLNLGSLLCVRTSRVILEPIIFCSCVPCFFHQSASCDWLMDYRGRINAQQRT